MKYSWGKYEILTAFWCGRREGRCHLGNLKLVLKVLGAKRIQQVQDRVQWRALMNVMVNFRVL
jgi:hypothetical protein